MKLTNAFRYFALTLLIEIATLAHALAADTFQALVDQSYGAYRAALFTSNANDKAGTLDALGSAHSTWSKVVASYRNSPPAAYAADPEFASSLDRISSSYEHAHAQATDGKLTEAHETLEAVRDALGDLRRRNGIIAFSDHINAYHTEMERVTGGEISTDDMRGLIEQAGVLAYLDRRIRENVPASYRDDPSFRKLAEENAAAVQRLRRALEAGNAVEIKEAVGGLKPAYAKLFLAFG